MKTITINKITTHPYKGYVYNLELETKSTDKDDLFWIEQKTGIVSHNCFPKDINSLIVTMMDNDIDPIVLKAVWEQNKKVRKNWDWATNPSAVKGENE